MCCFPNTVLLVWQCFWRCKLCQMSMNSLESLELTCAGFILELNSSRTLLCIAMAFASFFPPLAVLIPFVRVQAEALSPLVFCPKVLLLVDRRRWWIQQQ